MEIVRFRLQELIDAKGTSQSALSRDSGVSFTTISRLCRNVTAQVSLERSVVSRVRLATKWNLETSSSSRPRYVGRSDHDSGTPW